MIHLATAKLKSFKFDHLNKISHHQLRRAGEF
jgi:hypothetical protein